MDYKLGSNDFIQVGLASPLLWAKFKKGGAAKVLSMRRTKFKGVTIVRGAQARGLLASIQKYAEDHASRLGLDRTSPVTLDRA